MRWSYDQRAWQSMVQCMLQMLLAVKHGIFCHYGLVLVVVGILNVGHYVVTSYHTSVVVNAARSNCVRLDCFNSCRTINNQMLCQDSCHKVFWCHFMCLNIWSFSKIIAVQWVPCVQYVFVAEHDEKEIPMLNTDMHELCYCSFSYRSCLCKYYFVIDVWSG
jgi:hypothetical protein